MHSTILHSDAHKRVHCQHDQLLYKPDHGHWFRKCRRHCCSLNSPPFPSLPFSLALSLYLCTSCANVNWQKANLKPGPGDTFQIRHWLQANPNPQTWLKSTSAIAQNLCVKILKLFIHSFIHLCKYSHTQTVHVQLECFSGTSWRHRQRRASDMSRIMPTLLAAQWT